MKFISVHPRPLQNPHCESAFSLQVLKAFPGLLWSPPYPLLLEKLSVAQLFRLPSPHFTHLIPVKYTLNLLKCLCQSATYTTPGCSSAHLSMLQISNTLPNFLPSKSLSLSASCAFLVNHSFLFFLISTVPLATPSPA